MEVTEIWIRILISRTFFSRSFFCRSNERSLGRVFSEWLAFTYTLTYSCSISSRYKMPLLPAEQIGSGRWFNDCFWHPAIPLLHWILNIQLCALHCTHSRVHTKNSFYLLFSVRVYHKYKTNNNSKSNNNNDCRQWMAMVSTVWQYCGFLYIVTKQ